jgi:hypothetical protein
MSFQRIYIFRASYSRTTPYALSNHDETHDPNNFHPLTHSLKIESKNDNDAETNGSSSKWPVENDSNNYAKEIRKK